MDERIRRGDMRLFSFSRPDKRRPVLVLTRPEVIELLHTVMVEPVTSVIRGAGRFSSLRRRHMGVI